MSNIVRHSLAATVLALGLVASSVFISKFFFTIRHEKEITVKGFAKAPVTSDIGKIRFTISIRREKMEEAYRDLTAQREEILARVKEKAPGDLVVEQDNATFSERYKLNDEGKKTHQIEDYSGSGTVILTSSDVEWIQGIGPVINQFIGKGYDLHVRTPEFLVSDLGPLKQDLLEKATSDGYRRAELMAHNSGAQVGALRAAHQGVFQITEPNSTETSSYGMYDTSTIEKSMKAVVTLEYSVE
jgi:hypothetical protein